jgi:membrane protein YqaA with SNARE-associated domain
MSVTDSLIAWTKNVFLPLGPLGLFITAFIESTFFPIPPDVLLIPLVLADPGSWWFLGAVTTLGSVLGAAAGYYMGYRGGRPLMEKMVSERNIERVESYYDEYGILAVGIAGFSPVPYKVFTVTSGVFQLNVPGFIVVSTVSRGARFFLIAGILGFYGEQVVTVIETYLGPISVIVAGLIVVAYIIWKQYL